MFTLNLPLKAATLTGQMRVQQQIIQHDFNDLLVVHLSINLVNDQLDAQFFYFVIRLLQSSTCFEQRCAHHQEVKLH